MAIPEISVDELLLLKAAGEVRLVDVREDDEWFDSHIESAVHVALGMVPERLDAFGDDGATKPTYVICRVGNVDCGISIWRRYNPRDCQRLG